MKYVASVLGKTIMPKYKVLYGLIGLIIILNLFDLIMTFWLVNKFGYTAEYNPILYKLFIINPKLVIFFKVGIVIIFSMIMPLGAKKNFTLVYRGTQFVVCVFSIVFILHVVNFIRLSIYF